MLDYKVFEHLYVRQTAQHLIKTGVRDTTDGIRQLLVVRALARDGYMYAAVSSTVDILPRCPE